MPNYLSFFCPLNTHQTLLLLLQHKQHASNNKLSHKRAATTISSLHGAKHSLIIILTLFFASADSQCPPNTMASFERVNGVTVRDTSMLQVLFSAHFNDSSVAPVNNLLQQQQHNQQMSSLNSLDAKGLADTNSFLSSTQSALQHLLNSSALLNAQQSSLSGNIGLSRQHSSSSLLGNYASSGNGGGGSVGQLTAPITAECNNRCRRRPRCRAFLVDYERRICYSIENSQSITSTLINDHLINNNNNNNNNQNSIRDNNAQSMQGGLNLNLNLNLGGLATSPVQLIPTPARRTAYFEKICISNVNALECERAWFFERLPNYELVGADDKIIGQIQSRLNCEELCLSEREFVCKSGEYDALLMQCKLSSSDRHARHASLRVVQSAVLADVAIPFNSAQPATATTGASRFDYFENQCSQNLHHNHHQQQQQQTSTLNNNNPLLGGSNQLCDSFERHDDADLSLPEIMRRVNTSAECEQICAHVIKAFVCRSFTWHEASNSCFLSSSNTLTAGGIDKLQRAPGFTYYQRNDCLDIRLDCEPNSMTLNLRTREPFAGRMYVRSDNANLDQSATRDNSYGGSGGGGCEVVGRSANGASLSIPYDNGANGLQSRCFSRDQSNSKYTSIVVVQQHPLIQRKSDRFIKVVCDYQTSSKTISSSYNINANLWTSSATALINGTSLAPKIKLRITDRRGVDVSGAKLGDELYLRIEADSDSVYDMSARSVLAKSGATRETIVLIDKDGCPVDVRIFPALKRLNKRTLVAKFDAFKFSSDVVVRFQVDVQFCLSRCPPISCKSNSFATNDVDAIDSLDSPDVVDSSNLLNANLAPIQTTMSPSLSPSSSLSSLINGENGIDDEESAAALNSAARKMIKTANELHQHQQQQQQHQLNEQMQQQQQQQQQLDQQQTMNSSIISNFNVANYTTTTLPSTSVAKAPYQTNAIDTQQQQQQQQQQAPVSNQHFDAPLQDLQIQQQQLQNSLTKKGDKQQNMNGGSGIGNDATVDGNSVAALLAGRLRAAHFANFNSWPTLTNSFSS